MQIKNHKEYLLYNIFPPYLSAILPHVSIFFL